MAKLINEETVRSIINTTDNFLFDCDGVLWNDFGEISGSQETVKKLVEMGKRVFYMTNNSTKTRKMVVEKCQKLGFPAKEDSIMCSAYSTALYLKSKGFTDKVFVVGNQSLRRELDDCGIKHTGHEVNSETSQDFEAMLNHYSSWNPDPEIKGVVVGFDPSISYEKLIKAATYASDIDNLFIVTDEDSFLPIPGRAVFPGTGCLVATVRTAAHREPVVIGKPSNIMFELLHDSHGLDPAKTLMVGDRCDTDITMARNCGLHSLLVLSGCETLESLEAVKSSADPRLQKGVPDYYSECLGQFGDLM